MVDILTQRAVNLSLAESTPPSVSNFTTFNEITAPSSFLSTFEDECTLNHATDEASKLHLFPTLLKGPRATHAQTELRKMTTWKDMTNKFIELYTIDRNVVLTDL